MSIFRKSKKTTHTQSEKIYNILKASIEKVYGSRKDIENKYGYKINDTVYPTMFDYGLIKKHTSDNFKLTSEGVSAYLSMDTQRESSKLARKSIKYATWALVISIISFIASIAFNIISLP